MGRPYLPKPRRGTFDWPGGTRVQQLGLVRLWPTELGMLKSLETGPRLLTGKREVNPVRRLYYVLGLIQRVEGERYGCWQLTEKGQQELDRRREAGL